MYQEMFILDISDLEEMDKGKLLSGFFVDLSHFWKHIHICPSKSKSLNNKLFESEFLKLLFPMNNNVELNVSHQTDIIGFGKCYIVN